MTAQKKSVSIYMLILAAVMACVGLVFYRTAAVTEARIIPLTLVPAAIAVLTAVLVFAGKPLRVLNLAATVCAVLLAWALAQSVSAQLDPLGWWISGLYTFDQVRGYIIFAVLMVLALILSVIASFIDIKKA